MNVQGRDCSIVVKTSYRETVQFGEAELPGRNAVHFCGIPYAEETIREAVSLLTEEAAIEGDGLYRAIRKSTGVTGCVVTPLTIGTVPFLLYLAMGSAGLPLYVSETRNIYRYKLDLLPAEDSTRFDLIQDRAPFCKPNGDAENQGFSAHLMGRRKLYEGCAVTGFELRIHREEAVKLRLDIRGEQPPAIYPYQDIAPAERGERFMGDRVTYRINGTKYHNIYGLTLSVKKEGGTRTELWIKRVVNPYPYGFTTSSFAKQNSLNSLQPPSVAAMQGSDIPDLIEELTITAQLLRDKYEYRYYGMFRLTLSRLILTADETAVDCADGVIGPLRYYCAGLVQTEVFTTDGGNLE
jgi:hypothetical protein